VCVCLCFVFCVCVLDLGWRDCGDDAAPRVRNVAIGRTADF
jgi:hypothetical protein